MKLVALLPLLVLLLAGCLAPESGVDDAPAAADEVQGCPDPERRGVALWAGTYDARVGTPFEVDVDVPECARNAKFEITSEGMGSPKAGTVSLQACGEADVFGGGGVQIGVGSSDDGSLCVDPGNGMRLFQITSDSAMVGTATLRMDMVPE